MTGGKAMAYTSESAEADRRRPCKAVRTWLRDRDPRLKTARSGTFGRTYQQRPCDKPQGRRRPSKIVLDDAPQGPCFVKGSCRLSDAHIKWKDFKIQHILHKKWRGYRYRLHFRHQLWYHRLMTVDRSIRSLIDTEQGSSPKQQPEQIVHNVNDLLDTLIEQSVALVGKPAALMNKEEKVTAIQFSTMQALFLLQNQATRFQSILGSPSLPCTATSM